MSAVLVIAALKFKDIERYRAYQARFPEVFGKFNGRVLAADEAVVTVDGDPIDKMVVMQFPSEEEANAFRYSPDYLDIAKDRDAGADVTCWMAKALA